MRPHQTRPAILTPLFILAMISMVSPLAHAQDNPEDNSQTTAQVLDAPSARSPGGTLVLYAEFGGAGLLGSLNAEILLADRVALRAGLGAIPVDPSKPIARRHLVLPLSLSAFPLVSDNTRHRLEVGVGLTALPDGLEPLTHATLGYRYQQDGGLLIRLALTPMLNARHEVLPWGGVSLGYVF